MGQVGRYFQADIAIPFLGLLIDRPHDVRRKTNIPDGQRFVNGLGILGLLPDLRKDLRVIRTADDGFLEDGRIGGDALQAVLLDHPLQLAAGQECVTDVIEPGRLIEFLQANEWIVHGV